MTRKRYTNLTGGGFLAVAPLLSTQTASATPPGSVQVHVVGAGSDQGEIGSARFASPDGFLVSPGKARTRWQRLNSGSATCRFDGLEPGRCAVAVSHDLNGNRRTDTNLFGRPVEQWAVSNTARPKLRAPRFDESAFLPAEGEALRLTPRTAK